MSKAKKAKVERNLTYSRVQIERFVWKNYRYRPQIRVYANKELKRNKSYSMTVFPSDKQRPIEVDIEYGLMSTGKKEMVLKTAFREAVRIGNYLMGRPYRNGMVEFEGELLRRGLPSYGGVAEMGMKLHSYVCSGCGKVWALKERKLPPTKDPEQRGYKTTCCKALFKYGGDKHYTNEELQRARRNREG